MKKSIISLITALGIIGLVQTGRTDPVKESCIRPYEGSGWTGYLISTHDLGREITGLVTSIMALCSDGEKRAELIAVQEGNDINACGKTALCEEAIMLNEIKEKLGAAEDSEFEGSAIAYVLEKVLKRDPVVGYEPLKKALAASQNAKTVRGGVKTAIEKTFFAKGDATTADLDLARTHRLEYVQEASNRHVSLAYNVKDKIVNDLKIIPEASIVGDGEIGSLAIDSYTLEQAIYMELVDLTIQIEMMEADAIQFMVHQPLTLMTQTKPASADETPAAEENS